jgi:dihydroflavonol-4-reductase
MKKSQLSSAKAEQELGATFRPLGETIKDTVAWYQSHPDF